MLLLAILTATLVAGIGSVWLAALLGMAMLARYTQHMLSLAAGALLATAFMHLLPEAFNSDAGAKVTNMFTATTTTNTIAKEVAGPCWRVTACTPSATAS